MIKGLLKISAFSIALALLAVAVKDFLKLDIVHSATYWMIFFFWLMYLGIHLFVEFLRESLKVDTPLLVLAVIGFRLIVSLFAFLIAVMLGISDQVLFAINFSVLYLLFQVFEIISVLSNLRRNSS